MDDQASSDPGTGSPPERITRSRAAGWRLPAGAVIVDRTSRWGNPFTVANTSGAGGGPVGERDRALCRDRFRDWLEGTNPHDPDLLVAGNRTFDRRWMWVHLPELIGRTLCCPCPPGPCHGQVLLDLANRDTGIRMAGVKHTVVNN